MSESPTIPILMVDDLPENLLSLEAILEHMPFDLELIKAQSGQEGLRQALKRDFALILLDVQMPGMNGIEMAELLRTKPKTRHLPIIFVTAGMNNKSHIFKGYELGAVDYLIKPIEPVVLRSKVTAFCELYVQRLESDQLQSDLTSMIKERVTEISSLSFCLREETKERRRTEDELRESELKMRSVIESAYEAFVCMDANGSIVDWNKEAENIFGWRREEVLSRLVSDLLLPKRYSEKHILDLENFLAKGESNVLNKRIEIEMLHRDGHEFPVELSSWLIPSSITKLFGAFIRDISERRQAESALLALNEKLELKVEERSLQLEQSRRQIMVSERLASLGSIVAGVAHEMNTPIGNCVSLATTLDANAKSILKMLESGKVRRSDLDRYFSDTTHGNEILIRNLERAATLVQSFKQVAVDQTSNQRRKFDLAKAIEEDIVTIAPLYKKTPYKINLDLAPGLVLDSYPGPLGQIFTNFVSNALMHGFHDRPTGEMYLSTRLLNENNVEIVFRDDGNGIDKKHLSHVFDPFFTTKLGKGGSGLGLSIVYNLVVGVLGGSIAIESQPQSGTKLTVVLPVHAPEINLPL